MSWGFVDIFRKDRERENTLLGLQDKGFAFTEYRLEDRSHNRNAAYGRSKQKGLGRKIAESYGALLDHTAVVVFGDLILDEMNCLKDWRPYPLGTASGLRIKSWILSVSEPRFFRMALEHRHIVVDLFR